MDPSHGLQSERKYLATGSEDCRIRVSPNLVLQRLTSRTQLQVWEIDRKFVRNVFKSHTKRVRCLEFSPNGRFLLSAALDNTVRIWNMRGGSVKVFTNPESRREFKSATFSPDGKYVAAGNGDGIVRIWNVRTGQLVQRLKGHTGIVYGVMFMPDGKGLVSGSKDNTLKYWNITPFELHSWSLHTKEPQGRERTSDLAHLLRLLEAEDQTKPAREFSGHLVRSLSFPFSSVLSPNPNRSSVYHVTGFYLLHCCIP
jgi:WD40 repeat protein